MIKAYVVALTATCLMVLGANAQTKTTQLIIAGTNGQIKLNPPGSPGSGTRAYNFPSAPNGASIILSESTAGQTIGGPLTLTGPVTFGDQLSLTLGGSSGNSGDVLTRNTSGGMTWVAPSGGGGGVPTSRTLTTSSPLKIDNALSADLSANRSLSFDFSVANSWLNTQTFQATSDQGNAFVSSINSANTAIGVAQGGTGKTSLTSNRLLLGNGTGALTEVAAGNNGEVLALVNGVPTWQPQWTEMRVPNDTTYNAGALQEIPGLTFQVAANETWEIEAVLRLASTGSSGITFGVDVPSGNCAAVVSASNVATGGSIVRITGDANASTAVCTSPDQNHFAVIKGYVTIGNAGGTVQLKWGRGGGSGVGTIYAKSRLRVQKIQ